MGKIPSVRFITRKWAPAVGGMETYCLQLTEHIKDEVALEIIALPGQENGSVPRMPSLLAFGFKTALKLLSLPPTDVVHVSDMASWPLALIAKMRRPKTGIVLSAHGSDLSYGQLKGIMPWLYKVYMKLGAFCLPRAVVLANSNWISDLAMRTGFKSVRHIALASDILALSVRPSVKNNLFFAGRIMPSKGTSFIVKEVMPILPDNVTLRIAGTVCHPEEKALFDDPRVEFLGRMNSQDLAREYSAASVVIVPSIATEGFGLVAAEAAICGGVVIASNHTGLAEVCADGIGILAETSNAGDWKRKITDVMGWSTKERTAFVKRAQDQAQKKYNWTRVASDTVEAYYASI